MKISNLPKQVKKVCDGYSSTGNNQPSTSEQAIATQVKNDAQQVKKGNNFTLGTSL